MNLKSYIRGIGIGILVTTAIFLVSGVNDKKGGMTDAQVIARAKELGLVESTTLSEINNDVTPAIEDEMIAEETQEVVEEIVAGVEEQPAGEDTVESEIEAEETTTEAVEEAEEKKDDVEKSESEVVRRLI